MTLIAYDSARPNLIPANAAAVFPYADGHYSWSHLERPHALYRYITVLGDPHADIADVEPGCIWPPPAVRSWAVRRIGRGQQDLTVYVNRSAYPAVAAAMAGLNWHLFLATLDGSKPASYGGKPCRAVQYTDRNNWWDESVVYEPGWLNKPART